MTPRADPPVSRERVSEPLRNLGPRSVQMLQRAGIEGFSRLRELGAVRAFVAVKRSGAAPSLNLLWALEGAISDRPWQQVAKEERLRLLLQLEDEERGHASALDQR